MATEIEFKKSSEKRIPTIILLNPVIENIFYRRTNWENNWLSHVKKNP